MIRSVAFRNAAGIARAIVRVATGERAESDGRQELRLQQAQNLLRTGARDQVIDEGKCIQLVRTQRRIVSLRAVNDVVEVTAFFIPKPFLEGCDGSTAVVPAAVGQGGLLESPSEPFADVQ